ncbi:MAG: phage holin family protein [Neisseria sp.]|nr:phage holin family protein [Neisseria sp.]
MGVGNRIRRYRMLFDKGADLLALRLQLLRLDLVGQLAAAVVAVSAAVFAAALFLLAVISLLFGLNEVLADEMRLWVFFGIAGFCLLLIIVLFAYARTVWRRSSARLAETVKGVQQDIAYLRGKGRNVGEREGL